MMSAMKPTVLYRYFLRGHLRGPTDSTVAPKGSIRGDLGEDKMRNIVHASDSPEAAQAELQRFFNPGEVLA